MELACFPDSKLSAEVELRLGQGSSMRVSHWNGGDSETPEGVKLVQKLVRRYRPVHLWVSCECSPFCPLQRLNRKTLEQRQRLEEKQATARRQYAGAIEVARTAKRFGTQVHWELSEKCEAWSLPEIQNLLTEHKMEKAVCSGCAVGLRTKDGSKALCKAWCVASPNEILVQRLSLKCQKNHARGKCEAGETAHTARYTDAFVRKVVDALLTSEGWAHVVREVSSHPAQETLNVPEEALAEETEEDDGAEATEAERREVERKIQHIHRNTGHSSIENLIKALERRGVPRKIIRIAREWKCPVCTERRRPDPRRYASLETIAAKWEVLETDVATWVHPDGQRKANFMLFVDTGSRFMAGRVIHEKKTPGVTWEEMRQAFEEVWMAMFGKPKVLRVDPAGAWRSNAAEAYCNERNIILEPIPGEAHWQLSHVEGGIRTVKEVMTELANEFPGTTPQELLGRSLWVCNQREIYKGHSPIQHVLGRTPDDHDRLFQSEDQIPIRGELMADGGYRADVRMRATAEKAFAEAQAKSRLERAERMGHRRCKTFLPGDLVYYWRQQLPPGERGAFQSGKFIGPARVLATETRREEGHLRPGSVVWIHRGGRLLRAAPEQLRKASTHELEIEELKGPVELPWTISSLATDPSRRTFEDISGEIPDEGAWHQAAAESEEPRPRREDEPTRRMRVKGPLGEGDDSQAKRGKVEERQRKRGGDEMSEEASSSRPRVEEGFYTEERHRRAWEIELPLPESKRAWRRFVEQPEAFMTRQVQKKGVEVRERTLTEDEAKRFAEAKTTEVRNFLASECFKKAEGDLPPESEVIGMRWLLTWKLGDQYPDGKKAKARAVVLGYQDPRYATRPTSSPTPSKAGRQLFLQYCAWKRFKIAKGDISGAFLQGDKLEEEMWVRPLKEICDELGVAEDTPMLLRRAAYGLVQAPLHWYQSICRVLKEMGYARLVSEPCCWVYVDDSDGEVKSIIHGHVDDFVFGGKEKCPLHGRLMKELQERFKWGTWEHGEFEQCGLMVKQRSDYSISLSQGAFIRDIEEIHMSRDRMRQGHMPTTEKEKSAMRAVVGSLSWLCGQTCFMFSVDVNFLASTIPESTVDDMIRTNKLIRDVKKWEKQEYVIHSFRLDQELVMAAWADAAWANRPNGKDSTEGIFIGMSTPKLEGGFEEDVTAIYWRSSKISRVCRSPACAETMANLDAEDDLLYLRVLWHEICG